MIVFIAAGGRLAVVAASAVEIITARITFRGGTRFGYTRAGDPLRLNPTDRFPRTRPVISPCRNDFSLLTKSIRHHTHARVLFLSAIIFRVVSANVVYYGKNLMYTDPYARSFYILFKHSWIQNKKQKNTHV